MAKYTLRIPEVYYQDYTVEACSIEEAIKKFEEGDADVVEWAFEYSHTVDAMTDEEKHNWVVAKDGKPL